MSDREDDGDGFDPAVYLWEKPSGSELYDTVEQALALRGYKLRETTAVRVWSRVAAWLPLLDKTRKRIENAEQRLGIPAGWTSRRSGPQEIRKLHRRVRRILDRFALAVMRELGVT